MSYYLGKMLPLGFDESVLRVTEALKREGFGIIAEIDVKATLKHKINVEFRPYRIAGTRHNIINGRSGPMKLYT